MYGIYALVNLFSPNSLARCTRSFVLRKQINACVNTIRQHFPLRNLYILVVTIRYGGRRNGDAQYFVNFREKSYYLP